MNILEELKLQRSLKTVQTNIKVVNISDLIATEPTESENEERRNYFFQAAVDKWYNNLKQFTFKSEFVTILPEEAKIIINYWNDVSSKDESPTITIPNLLNPLIERIDQKINENFDSNKGIFAKLSTRSPKDSKTIFSKATERYKLLLDSNGIVIGGNTSFYNDRLIAFSNEMVKAAIAKNGKEVITYFLDSHRVAEDLMYAIEEGSKEFDISIIIREWDERVTPKLEFRGFVWDYNLNCIGQYWHSLYFPELKELKDQVANDILNFYNSNLKATLPIPNAMLDLMWLGPGQVMLIEINPLMEGLGSFKGSTGLFDYYEDEAILTGKSLLKLE